MDNIKMILKAFTAAVIIDILVILITIVLTTLIKGTTITAIKQGIYISMIFSILVNIYYIEV